MSFFKKILDFQNRFKDLKNEEKIPQNLNRLLSDSPENKSLEDQLYWLVQLLEWIRQAHDQGGTPNQRLEFLLKWLQRSPQRKKSVALVLRSAINRVSGLTLYSEIGLPREWGIWSEFSDRILLKVLPTPPLEHDLGSLMGALFPDRNDAQWVLAIQPETFQQIIDLLYYEIETPAATQNPFVSDMTDAFNFLVIQIRAIGLSPSLRERMNNPDFKGSAFYRLDSEARQFLEALENQDKKALQNEKPSLKKTMVLCHDELNQIHSHLDEFGVSINLVFQIMRLNRYLQRLSTLVDLLAPKETEKVDSKGVTEFLSNLIIEIHELRSLRSLLSQNMSLIARKIVERAAETGEHYITRNRTEYQQMLRAATGGGVIAAFVVYLKIGILSLQIGGFFEGLMVSLLYSVGFLTIHFMGFTLGTKQSAMTAPALAEKMQKIDSKEGLRDLVTEISYLIRSQVASVFGNLIGVIPVTFLIHFIYQHFFQRPLWNSQITYYAHHGSDLLGPSFLYAALTGVLLWLSSLIAGWGDNWFALHRLRKTLARSPHLIALFGKTGARSMALFFQKHFSAFFGNISLGFFLGMLPSIFKFMSLPLDIRHVTISAGNLGSVLPVLGFDFLKTGEFWRAFLGVLTIGSLNVLVSFGLAFITALKARNMDTNHRTALRKYLIRYFLHSPLSFFFPAKNQDLGRNEEKTQ